jgi:3-dehydroquinate synthase
VKRIKVNLENSAYDVLVGARMLREAGANLLKATRTPSSKCIVVTSPVVRKLWGKTLEDSFRKAGLNYSVIEVDDGERSKTFRNMEKVLGAFVQHRADRKSLVIALGGGVICDIAGFAASIFMRGIPVVQIPTTLLAQADAAIGGKTGVNLPGGKNLAGTFHQPKLVIVDTDVLSTLPDREYRAGIFEIIKCGAISDAKLFAYMTANAGDILKRDSSAVLHLVSEALKIKAKIVAEDERESDNRRLLNFGHTIGHALEAATSYRRYLHGEAVGLGMLAAVNIGTAIGITPISVAQKMFSTVNSYGPLPPVNVPDETVLSLLGSDKKTVNGSTHFVLLKDIGRPVITSDVPAAAVKYGMEVLRSAFRQSRSHQVSHG